MSWDKPSSGGSDHPGSPRPGDDRYTAGRESRDAPPPGETREGDGPPQADRIVPGHRLRNAWDYVRDGTVTTDPIPGRPIRRETDPPPALDHRAGYVSRVPESASRDAGLLREDAFARDRSAARPETTSRQPETADRKPERVQQLETELKETRTERSQLIEAVTRQTARIEKLETQVDRLASENERLKTELAKKDKPAEGRVPEESSSAEVQAAKQADAAEKGETLGETEPRKRIIHLPSDKAAGIFTAAVGAADAIGTTSHILTSGETSIIGAAAALGVAGYLWGKSKWEKKHDD